MAPSDYPPRPSYSAATLPYASLRKDRPANPVYHIQPIYDQVMVTYHVCRVCGRPRSDRYHREHPLAINVVPPSPGICRRCRVTGEDKDDSDDFQLPRSHARIGIECLVPETAVITQEEIKYDRGRGRAYREVTVPQNRGKSRRRIIYHVTLPDDGQVAVSRKREAAVSIEHVAAPKEDNAKAVQTQRPVLTPVKDKTSEGKLSRQAGDTQTRANKRYGYTEAEIRILARDEIERYRQAERRIEGHPAPYAHGKLVAVSRPLEPVPHSDARAVENRKPVLKLSTPASKPSAKILDSSDDRGGARQPLSKQTDKAQNLSSRRPTHPVKSQNTSTEVHPPSMVRQQHEVDVERQTVQDKSRNKEQRSGAATQRTTAHECERTTIVVRAKPVEVESVAQSSPVLVRDSPSSNNVARTNSRSKEASGSSEKSKSAFESRRDLDILIDDDSSVLEHLEGAPLHSSHTSKHTLIPVLSSKHGHTPSMHSSNSISHKNKDVSAKSRSKEKNTSVVLEEYIQPEKESPAQYWMSSGRNDDSVDSDTTFSQDFVYDAPRDRGEAPTSVLYRAQQEDSQPDHTFAREMSSASRDSEWTGHEYWIDGCIVQASHRNDDGTIVIKSKDGLRYYPLEDQIIFGMLPKTSTDAVHEVQSPAGVTIGSVSYRSSKASDHQSKSSEQTATKQRAQPQKEATYDYEYRQRKVVPASGVVDMKHFERSSPDIVQESEEIFIYRPQRSKANSTKANSVSPADILKNPPSRAPSSTPSPIIRSEHASERTGRTGRTLDATRPAQVHFANKVAISPTPPGSDDYPLTTKESTDRSLRGLHQNLAKIRASSSRSRTNSTRSETQTRRAEADISFETRSGRTSDRPDASVPVEKNKLSSQALSESPSRERYLAKRDVSQSERSSRRHSPERRRPVPHGPYTKEEVRSASLDVESGSAHGRAQAASVREL